MYFAKLVKGTDYTIRGTRFTNGIAKEVSEDLFSVLSYKPGFVTYIEAEPYREPEPLSKAEAAILSKIHGGAMSTKDLPEGHKVKRKGV